MNVLDLLENTFSRFLGPIHHEAMFFESRLVILVSVETSNWRQVCPW